MAALAPLFCPGTAKRGKEGTTEVGFQRLPQSHPLGNGWSLQALLSLPRMCETVSCPTFPLPQPPRKEGNNTFYFKQNLNLELK